MSDNWIFLIPHSPKHVPTEEKRRRALTRFTQFAPEADKIEETISDTVRFFDCGSNFERILCPSCRAEIPIDWWQDQMSGDGDSGFDLQFLPLPCCGGKKTLNDLEYEWPQGFGRFSIEAMNPNIGKLEDTDKAKFEAILECPLKVIYRHV